MNIALGISGVRLSAVASFYDSETGSYTGQEVRAEVVLHDEHAKEYYAALEAQRPRHRKGDGRTAYLAQPTRQADVPHLDASQVQP